MDGQNLIKNDSTKINFEDLFGNLESGCNLISLDNGGIEMRPKLNGDSIKVVANCFIAHRNTRADS